MEKLRQLGGVTGLADTLQSHAHQGLDPGVTAGPASIEEHRRVFGANTMPSMPQKNFFMLCFENIQDPIILLLIAAALVNGQDGMKPLAGVAWRAQRPAQPFEGTAGRQGQAAPAPAPALWWQQCTSCCRIVLGGLQAAALLQAVGQRSLQGGLRGRCKAAQAAPSHGLACGCAASCRYPQCLAQRSRSSARRASTLRVLPSGSLWRSSSWLVSRPDARGPLGSPFGLVGRRS